jgi:hypothetical protein
MEKRLIKFNAWLPAIGLMLEGVTVYADDMIGIDSEEFENQLKEKKGPRYKIYDDVVFYKGETDEDDIFDHVFTLLTGEDWYWIEKGDFVLLEYSGWKDTKGNELWEGDICSNDAAKWEVIFNTGCFCGKMIGGLDHDTHLALRGIKGLVKIGTIFQNPELLKQK